MELQEALQIITTLFIPQDIIELRPIQEPRRPGPQQWVTAEKLPELAADLRKQNKAGWHLYFGVMPRKASGGSTDADCCAGHALWADFDHITPTEALVRVAAAKLPEPSLVVNSGHGTHTYWRLAEAVEPGPLSAAVADLAVLLDSDRKVCNPSRILRIPGTLNWKKDQECECTVVNHSDKQYAWAELSALIPARPAPAPPEAKSNPRMLARAEAAVEVIPGAKEGTRNAEAFRISAYLQRDFGIAPADAWKLLQAWNSRNQPPLPVEELQACLQSGERHGKHPVQATPTSPSNQLVKLRDIVRKRPEWLWKNHIPAKAITLIAGHPGCGKSRCLMELCSRMSTGRAWPDGTPGNPPCKILYITAEDPVEEQVSHVFDLTSGDEDNIYIRNGPAMIANGGLDTLLAQDPSIKVVVLDPLTACLGGGVDAFRDNEVRAVLEPLQRTIDNYGVTVLVIKHFRKETKEISALQAISDSHAFGALARAVWVAITQKADAPDRHLWLCAKQSLARIPKGFAYNMIELKAACGAEIGIPIWETQRVETTADDALAAANKPPDTKIDACRAWLLERLAAGPVNSRIVTIEAEELDWSKRTLDAAKASIKVKSKKVGPYLSEWSL